MKRIDKQIEKGNKNLDIRIKLKYENQQRQLEAIEKQQEIPRAYYVKI